MTELSKAFEAGQHEDGIYKKWEESGFFNPDVCVRKKVTKKSARPFSMVLPPPNVTGTLHIGHAMMLAIEDLMARYHRMRGDKTLWVPGTDHAAIATQTKVEKLLREQGMKDPKKELGREKFLAEVNKFAQKSHDTIVNQCKKMGSSLDWSREAFTLDALRERAVRTVFKQMYDDGLIYRGYRIVNWCPHCHSTLADDEVEYKPAKTKLYWIKYGPFTLATTRPETKLGDTAVAVHPDDKRYAHMVGKKYMIPGVLGEFEITVVADSAVDKDFGSGAIKVTPYHSFADYEIAQRHGLPGKQIIDEDGRMMKNCGKYAGLTAKEARAAIVADMEKMGLIDHIDENYENSLSVCYRCGTPIEPIPSRQWFIDVNKKFALLNPAKSGKGKALIQQGKASKIKGIKLGQEVSLKDLMQTVVKNGQIEIIPDRFGKTYFHWIDNLRDWCISRQLWYGHRIPVWYRGEETYVGVKSPNLFHLHFRNPVAFQAIKAGQKTVETRALNPEEPERYFGLLQRGDEIVFDYLEDGKIKESLKAKIKKVSIYHNAAELLQHENLDEIAPKKIYGAVDLEKFWASIPGYREKIDVNGAIALKLEKVEPFVPETNAQWTQDPDTLDTWFSSGLWTFSTLGWPDKTMELKTFHPTALLETGYDILFFWVARMILMSGYALGEIPFEKVYLHGLVRDEQGRKMSKSLGNVIDPLDMVSAYGADATRLSLVIGNAPGNDTRLSEEKIAGFRNFTNKLWNISRFMLLNIQSARVNAKRPRGKTLADKWILSRLDFIAADVTKNLENYQLSFAGEELRDFTWGDLADWYLEIAKIESGKTEILNYLLNTILKLWHPFMPYVTEAIWQEVYKGEMLMVAHWPLSAKKLKSPKAISFADFDLVKNIITGIRSLRADNKIEPAKKISVSIGAGAKEKLLKKNAEIIMGLARLDGVQIKKSTDKPANSVGFVIGGCEVFADLSGVIDAGKEKARLEAEIKALEGYIEGLERKLANAEFVKNAPAAVVEKERGKFAEAKEKMNKLKNQN